MTTCEEWPVVWPCDEQGQPNEPNHPDTLISTALDVAQEILWAHTGRRLGQCEHETTVSFQPRTLDCRPMLGDSSLRAHAFNARTCGLWETPVVSVDEVVSAQGATLPATAYRLSGSQLSISWPSDEFVIRYTAGEAVGTLDAPTAITHAVAAAMGELATEVLKGMCGGTCRLPSRATSVSKQNVTITFAEPERYVELGLLGLALSDALIRATNANRLPRASAVFTPDVTMTD